ncbi:MAG: hypothetical protein M3N57_04455 [Actinomycetota bacterium]|nr:hypothetical protein [Actinomycetota bacterium]
MGGRPSGGGIRSVRGGVVDVVDDVVVDDVVVDDVVVDGVVVDGVVEGVVDVLSRASRGRVATQVSRRSPCARVDERTVTTRAGGTAVPSRPTPRGTPRL